MAWPALTGKEEVGHGPPSVAMVTRWHPPLGALPEERVDLESSTLAQLQTQHKLLRALRPGGLGGEVLGETATHTYSRPRTHARPSMHQVAWPAWPAWPWLHYLSSLCRMTGINWICGEEGRAHRSS